jgi:hypothetical protein
MQTAEVYADTRLTSLLIGPGEEASVKGKGDAALFVTGWELGGSYLYVVPDSNRIEEYVLLPGEQHEYLDEAIVLIGLPLLVE